MKATALFTTLLFTLPTFAAESSDEAQQTSKREKDRQAILSMAGHYDVSFDFEETVALDADYELKDPYHAEARELVVVADQSEDSVTLQHLLIVEGERFNQVIKHWAQIWQYEDTNVLEHVRDNTWKTKTLSEDEVKGTWTQFVTQVDDSPRYKSAGEWTHDGNLSVWTSNRSTRPLPRREYTYRSDYDRLEVINEHVITPEGWVHRQDNRKRVNRDGQTHYLCLEHGLNQYTRITEDSELAAFEPAQEYWDKTAPFWAEVKDSWQDIIADSEGTVSYTMKADEDGFSLREKLSDLADTYGNQPQETDLSQIDTILTEHVQ